MKIYIAYILLVLGCSAQVVVVPGGVGTVPGSTSGGGGTYTAGSGITLPGNAITVDTTLIATRANAQSGADNTCTDAGGDDTYACTASPCSVAFTKSAVDYKLDALSNTDVVLSTGDRQAVTLQ